MEFDIRGDEFVANPYPMLAEMRRAHPCWYDHSLGVHVITRFADVERVLRDSEFSSKRVEQFARGAPPHLQDKVDFFVRELGRWVLFVDPPHHGVLRMRLLRSFGPRFIPLIEATTRTIIERTLGEIGTEDTPDIMRRFAYPVSTYVLAKLLGISDDDVEKFKAWTTDIFTLIGIGVADENAVETGYRGALELRDYVLDLLAQKRRAPEDDILTFLARPLDGETEEVSDEDIVGLFMSMIVAGHETTSNLIGNAIANISRDGDSRRWIADNGLLTTKCVDELIRYDGPVSSMMRRARRDIVIAGKVVKQGEIILSMLNAANRDPRRHADPDRIDFHRDDTTHVGLGVGIHACLGAAMARIVVAQAVTRFFQAYPDLEVAPGCTWARNLSFRAYTSLPVELAPLGADGQRQPRH